MTMPPHPMLEYVTPSRRAQRVNGDAMASFIFAIVAAGWVVFRLLSAWLIPATQRR